jgi:Kef-type K+ transport system membrane component KefB
MTTFPQWIIVLIVAIVLARISALLARRFDLPTATLQLIIGTLLGPSLFNVLGTPIILGTWGSPAPSPIHAVLKILAEIGLIQLMFVAGLDVDWHELKKVFKSSFSLGAWGFLLTAVSVTILMRLFVGQWTEALAMSAIMAASSFGISVYNLTEMKFLGSRAANVLLGAAGVCGVHAVLLMIASQAANYGMAYGVSRMLIAVPWFLAKLIMFYAIAYFLTSRFLKFSSKSGFQKRPKQTLIGYLLLVASLYAWASMHFGSFAAVGVASLGGALIGLSNPEVKEKIAKGFGSILASIPVGILFIVIGMEANLRAAERSIILLALLIGIVGGSKLMGCWVATRKGHESTRERALIMFGSLCQGEMGILIAAYLSSRGLVDPSGFNIAIIAAPLLTMISPILMKIASAELGTRAARARVGGSKKFNIFTHES